MSHCLRPTIACVAAALSLTAVAPAVAASPAELPAVSAAYQLILSDYLYEVDGAALEAGAIRGLRGALPASVVVDESPPPEGERLERFLAFYQRTRSLAPALTPAQAEAAAIRGMVGVLRDSATQFTPPAEPATAGSALDAYSGIGVQLAEHEGELVVQAVFAGGPAWQSGLSAGDRLVAIDGAAVRGMGVEGAIARIRGQVGTSVSLTLRRDGEELPPVAVSRAEIEAMGITTPAVHPDLAYIRLSSFFEDGAANALGRVLRSVPPGGVILDLRSSWGGPLRQAAAIASLFVGQGPLFSTSDRHGALEVYQALPGRLAYPPDLPLVVLVDERTVGSVEALAHALSGRPQTVLIGGKTAGYGDVTTTHQLPGGGRLSLLTNRLLTRDGTAIQANGIVPDLGVPSSVVTKRETLLIDDRGGVRGHKTENRTSDDPRLRRAVQHLLRAVPLPGWLKPGSQEVEA